MKKVLKWTLRIGGGLVVLLVAAILMRNMLIRSGAEAAVTRATGFPLTIGSFDLGLTASRIEIVDLRLSNPEGFEDPRCLHLPRVAVQVEPSTLLGDELHIEDLVLDVGEVVVVRNAAGETNLDRLRAVADSGKEERKGKEEPPEGKEPFRWKCDRLELSIGKVVFLDYSRMKDGEPRRSEWDLDVEKEVFRDVDGPDKIVRLIVLKVVQKTPIRLVTGTVEALGEGLGGVVNAAGDLVGGAASALGKGVEAVGEGIKGAGEAIKDLLGGGK